MQDSIHLPFMAHCQPPGEYFRNQCTRIRYFQNLDMVCMRSGNEYRCDVDVWEREEQVKGRKEREMLIERCKDV